MERTCKHCIHYEVCYSANKLTNPYACRRYRDTYRISAYIDWDTYDETLKLLDCAKSSVKRLRDSQTKSDITRYLDQIENLLHV